MFTVHARFVGAAAVVAVLASGLSGCATSSESASKQSLTENVGRYNAPPAGIIPPPRTSGTPLRSI